MKSKFLKSGVIVTALLLCLSLVGCSAFNVATGVNKAVTEGVILANGELPAFVTAGLVTAAEEPVAQGYINFVSNLNTQYESCIQNAQNTMLKNAGKFVACLNIFSAGLSDKTELAALRVLNPKAQAKAQIWAGFFQAAINVAVIDLRGMSNPAPQIAPMTATTADIKSFAEQAGLKAYTIEVAEGK